MPQLTFVLPHWLYWGGAAALPARRDVLRRAPEAGEAPAAGRSSSYAYLFWLTARLHGPAPHVPEELVGLRLTCRSSWRRSCTATRRHATSATTSRAPYAALEQAQTAAEARKPAADAPPPRTSPNAQKAQADLKPRQAEYDAAHGVQDAWRCNMAAGSRSSLGVMLLVDAVPAAGPGAPPAHAPRRRDPGRGRASRRARDAAERAPARIRRCAVHTPIHRLDRPAQRQGRRVRRRTGR